MARFGVTYEGLKLVDCRSLRLAHQGFGVTYEGLKRVQHTIFPSYKVVLELPMRV